MCNWCLKKQFQLHFSKPYPNSTLINSCNASIIYSLLTGNDTDTILSYDEEVKVVDKNEDLKLLNIISSKENNTNNEYVNVSKIDYIEKTILKSLNELIGYQKRGLLWSIVNIKICGYLKQVQVVNFLDTADDYGEAEKILGKVVEPFRDEIIISTKVGVKNNIKSNLSYDYIKLACENSLKNL